MTLPNDGLPALRVGEVVHSAPVGQEQLPGDEAALLARQKGDAVSDLLRLGDTSPDHRAVVQLFSSRENLLFAPPGQGHVGVGEAGKEGIHGHAVATQLEGETASQDEDGSLLCCNEGCRPRSTPRP